MFGKKRRAKAPSKTVWARGQLAEEQGGLDLGTVYIHVRGGDPNAEERERLRRKEARRAPAVSDP